MKIKCQIIKYLKMAPFNDIINDFILKKNEKRKCKLYSTLL